MREYGSYYNITGSHAPISDLGCGCSSGCSLGTETNQHQKPVPLQTWIGQHTDKIVMLAFFNALVLAGGAIYFVTKELT